MHASQHALTFANSGALAFRDAKIHLAFGPPSRLIETGYVSFDVA